MAAAEKGCDELVRNLADKGAKLNVRNNNFQNVLHLAAGNETDSCFREILEKDINCQLLQDKESTKGETPIHKIVREGKQELFDYVISKNLDPDVIAAKNFSGDTPCHIAAKKQKLSILKSIIQKFPFTLNIKKQKRVYTFASSCSIWKSRMC